MQTPIAAKKIFRLRPIGPYSYLQCTVQEMQIRLTVWFSALLFLSVRTGRFMCVFCHVTVLPVFS